MKQNAGNDEARRPRVLIVDGHVSIREMLALALDRQGYYTMTADAATGLEGLRLYKEQLPHIVISELSLPELSGPDLLTAIRETGAGTKVIFFASTLNNDLLQAGLAAEPDAFIHKTEPIALLYQALHAVQIDGSFFGPLATGLKSERRYSVRPPEPQPSRPQTPTSFLAERLRRRPARRRQGVGSTSPQPKFSLWDFASALCAGVTG